ncbi:hypothetical protein FQN54_006544 [Arachnomyces sp. PD_36]|nr:hypothetical protein FQN54_006544 [Arachnomyces sp. PD_36]
MGALFNMGRQIVRSISRVNDWPWGYVIYRTVYTPESYRIWDSALEKIDTLIYQETEDERREHVRRDCPDSELPDGRPNQYLREGYEKVVMDDKALYENASLDQIRDYFRSWAGDNKAETRYDICLVIDGESLDSIMPHPVPRLSWQDPCGFVLAVDRKFTPGGYDNEYYEGWMRVEIDVLFRLYGTLVGGGVEMNNVCPFPGRAGPIPIYDGASGSFVEGEKRWVFM